MKSSVAAVLGPNRAMRVVIDQPSQLHFHLTEGEQLVVIPNFQVEEPAKWEEIPNIVATVEKYVEQWRKSS